MSILASQTKFILINTTPHFLEITISAEQDEEFRMVQQSSLNVTPVSDLHTQSKPFISWVMEGILDAFTGTKLKEIKINLPGNSQVPVTIRCTSTLAFDTCIKSSYCTEIIPGNFTFEPENQKDIINIKWETFMSYGYDANGNVAIGDNLPTYKDMSINCTFFGSDNSTITGIDVTPACCKVSI